MAASTYSTRARTLRPPEEEEDPYAPQIAAERQKIEMARLAPRLNSLRMRTLQSGGLNPANEQRIQQRYAAEDALGNIEGARAPLPREQSRQGITDARDSLLKQGLNIADIQRQAAQARIKSGMGTQADTASMADANRMEAGFNNSFATPLPEAEVDRRMMANQGAIARAQLRRSAFEENLAGDDRLRREAKTFGNDLTREVRSAQLAQVKGSAAPAQIAAASAAVEADPTVVANRSRAAQLRAAAEGAMAQGDYDAYSGTGPPTPGSAARAQQGRGAAMAQYDFDESSAGRLAAASKAIRGSLSIGGGVVTGGNMLGGGNEDVLAAIGQAEPEIGKLERMAETNPDLASEWAQRLLADLPQSELSTSYGPFASARRAITSRVVNMRDRLRRLVR